MSEPLIVFSAVNDDSKKQMLLQKILSSDGMIFFKDKSDRSVALKPISVNSNFQLKCLLPETSAVGEDHKIITANFALDDDKYIFDAKPVVGNTHVTLTVLNLFHLQKRRNYRYVLPENYTAQFVVNTLNKESYTCYCSLLDLSTEGCAAMISEDDANFSLEDKVTAEIFLGDRKPITVQGAIKNIRVKNGNALVLGILFNYLGNSSEEKIVHYLTDLQREIYFRKAS